MKVFTNKKIKNKIIGVLLVIMLFNFIIPTGVRADVSGGLGGALAKPILDLLVYIGDGVMHILHWTTYDMDEVLLQVDLSINLKVVLFAVLGFVIGVIIVILAFLISRALGTIVLQKLGITVLSMVSAKVAISVGVTALAGGVIGAYYFSNTVLPDDFYLPLYVVTPYEIFRGNIPIFDVNFFKDYGDEKGTKKVEAGNETVTDFSKLVSIANELTNFLKDDLTNTAKDNGNIKDDYKKIVDGKKSDNSDAIYGNMVNALKTAEANPSTFNPSNFFAEYNIGNILTYLESFANDPNPTTYIKRKNLFSKK